MNIPWAERSFLNTNSLDKRIVEAVEGYAGKNWQFYYIVDHDDTPETDDQYNIWCSPSENPGYTEMNEIKMYSVRVRLNGSYIEVWDPAVVGITPRFERVCLLDKDGKYTITPNLVVEPSYHVKLKNGLIIAGKPEEAKKLKGLTVFEAAELFNFRVKVQEYAA